MEVWHREQPLGHLGHTGGQDRQSEGGAEPDGGAALEHVEQESGRAQTLAAGAQDIGGTDVAAAGLADVLFAEEPHQQVSGGDGTEQISGGYDEHNCRDHNE